MVLDYLGEFEASLKAGRVFIPVKLLDTYRERNPGSNRALLAIVQFGNLRAIRFLDLKYLEEEGAEGIQYLQRQKIQIENEEITIPGEFLKKINPNLEDRLVFTGAFDSFYIQAPNVLKRYEKILEEDEEEDNKVLDRIDRVIIL